MSTDLAETETETYDTRYGCGILVWCGGQVVKHRLPQSGPVPAGKGRVLRPADARLPERRKSNLVVLLERYFSGEPVLFPADLPVDKRSWTSFGADVAAALKAVTYGAVISYADLAAEAGHPRAQRAVGSFLARNPYPIIFPCHRVIRADGSIGGFSAGRRWKSTLLKLEGINRHASSH